MNQFAAMADSRQKIEDPRKDDDVPEPKDVDREIKMDETAQTPLGSTVLLADVGPEQQPEQLGEEPPETLKLRTVCWKRFVQFYWTNEFVLLIIAAICLARAYPPLGAEYLAPEITSTWIVVIFIFILAGLRLKTEEFSKAFQRLYFNVAVQVFNFGVVSAIAYGVSRGLAKVNAISEALADGIVICAALPLTINMSLILTLSSGGDEAAAIFNAAFGNLVGVFLSPVLILGYLGVSGDVDIWDIFYKLALRVILPVLVGQLLQKFAPPVVAFVEKHKKGFAAAQQYCLVFIVYTVFCETFSDDVMGDDASVGDIFITIAVVTCLLVGVMVLSWYSFGLLFPGEPKLRVTALFGSTHKTVAMGVPMINAIYEGNPLVGLYTLPLLIWHPLQLLFGTYLAPRLKAWVERELEQFGQGTEEDDEAPSDIVNDATDLGADEESPPLPSSKQDEEEPCPEETIMTTAPQQ